MTVGLLLVHALSAQLALPELLGRLAEVEKRLDQAPRCRCLELQTVEELDSDGQVKGREIRRVEVTRNGRVIESRKVLEVKAEGEKLSSSLRREPGKDKPKLSPFHPDAKGLYRFALGKAEEGKQVITFEPVEPTTERAKGQVTVDASTGRLLSISTGPAKLPLMLSAFQLDVDYADGPCVAQPSRVRLSGIGGLLFLKVRFRVESSYQGCESLESAPPRL